MCTITKSENNCAKPTIPHTKYFQNLQKQYKYYSEKTNNFKNQGNVMIIYENMQQTVVFTKVTVYSFGAQTVKTHS